jgi:transposase
MKESRSMKQISIIGFDLAKQLFHVHCAETDGSPVVSRRLRRGEVMAFFKKLSPCLVGMEACGGSHYWAREITKLGHDVRLIPPVCAENLILSFQKISSNLDWPHN